jgi:hypothetical protein
VPYYHIISISGNVLTYPGGTLEVYQLPDDFAPELYRISVETFSEPSEPDESGCSHPIFVEEVNLVALADLSPYTPSDYLVVVNEDDGSISIRRSDGASIPVALGNRDYQEFLVIDTDREYCPREYHPTVEERWAAIRSRRDMLLTACDWTQISDVPLTEEQTAAWREYRQALRDIPQTFATPEGVVWPTPPEMAATSKAPEWVGGSSVTGKPTEPD